MASVFFSYSHVDESLRDQLEKQLAILKRTGIIETWHDRRIGAGGDIDRETDRHVDTDDIILLRVSADFLASDYCYDREMRRAMERHAAGEAIAIPIILRACDWKGAPFGHLNATPPDGRPITQFPDRDQAMLEVAKEVRAAAEKINLRKGGPVIKSESAAKTPVSTPARIGPRSSNLRLAKEFTDRDKEQFKHETFEYLAKFFANSLEELSRRNAGIDGSFRRDGNRFTTKVYKNGKSVAQCTIFMRGKFGVDGIAFSNSDTSESNSFNEMLTVKADDQSLYWETIGISGWKSGREKPKLSQEGAAELCWQMLISHLQSN